MVKKVHVVPHSHWDREWYFTTSRSKIYLLHNLQKVLSLLEADNGYDHYVLDGQASLLDDYLAWQPEDAGRIKTLVTAGKLIVGPWYTQTDQMVISGESIVRNMQYGLSISEKFGKAMPIGYVPDSFGQSAAMPQIYQEFGIEDTLFWRGVSDDDVAHTEYRWRGEDGSVVNVYQIPSGYYIGGEIPENDTKLATFLNEDPFKKTWSRSTTDQVLFPNGFDQAPARENLKTLVDQMNDAYDDFELEISTFEKYVTAIKAQHPELEEISGELLNGKLMRIHKSIFSSRSDLKQLNTQTQNYLINTLEPLLSLAYSLGFDYPSAIIVEIWKLMFENAAHDSIGSCVSDTTNEDVYFRYKKAHDLAINLAELTMRNIATHIQQVSDITLTAFNTGIAKQTGVFETTLYVPSLTFAIEDPDGNPCAYTVLESEDQTAYILGQGNILNPEKDQYKPDTVYKVKVAIELTDLPALGYVQLHLNLTGNTLQKQVEETDPIIENDFYKIQVNAHHSLDILDKQLNRLYQNQAIIEENGDDGDSFNYSPPRADWLIHASDFEPTFVVKSSDLMSSLTLNYVLNVPKDLTERANHQASVSLPVTLQVTLKKGSPFIDFSFTVDNRDVDSHRMCVLFDTGIASKFSFADQQFGVIQRPVVREKEMARYNQNPDLWNEMPIAIETCQSFVSLENDVRGVAVVPKGVREYEIVGDAFDTIRLTLFRTYGFMGKENLLYRPGRASGETVIATPDAQLHREMTYDFSVVYYQGDLSTYHLSQKVTQHLTAVDLYQYAEYLNTRLRFTQFDVPKTLPLSYSLVDAKGDLVLSVLKKSETRPGLILRCYNGDYQTSRCLDLHFKKPLKLAQIVNLKEEAKSTLTITDNQVVLPELTHSKFVTLYVEFDD